MFDFYNLSQDGQSYIWDFDDGDSSQTDNPSHTYLGDGTYCVKLETKAYYNTGIATCVDSIRKCVLIYPLSVLYVPNAFTPNSDTNNEFFAVSSSRIDEFYMVIYNRWGEVLYRSYDITMSWDGKYNGNDVPAGVYCYEILYRDVKQKRYEQKDSSYPNVKTLTPFLEYTYKITKHKSLRIESQYLETGQDLGSFINAIVEFNYSPHWSVSIGDMVNTKPHRSATSTIPSEIIHYYSGFVGYTSGPTVVTAGYIKQVQGVNCTGGICRVEPAFSGARLTLTTSF